MSEPTITATGSLDVTSSGAVGFEKNPDTPTIPASTIKVLTFAVARTIVTDAMLDDTVTFAAADMQNGSTANLQDGDVLTWRHLFYGMMLPSGNDAAACICRTLGQHLIDTGQSTSTPLGAFYDRMRSLATSWGWTGHVITDGWGLSTSNRLTPRQLCQLMHDADPFMLQVMGTLSWSLQVTGANARTYTISHTVDPDGAVEFPEFVAAKTGTNNGANVVMAWDTGGVRHVTAIMGSTSADRFTDLRAVMDYVIGDDPPDPVGGSGLFRTNGDPVAVYLTDGTPATLATT